MPEKATRHDLNEYRGLTTDAQAGRLSVALLRVETATYLTYELLCRQTRVEPLTLDQFLKRAEERDDLWRSQCALEDAKQEAELKKARELTRELAPKLFLEQVLHHLSALNHDGTIVKDLSKLSCPEHGPKDWESWCRDSYAGDNTPTYDEKKLRKSYENLFSSGASSEHSALYCWKETETEVVNPKGPRYPRFPTVEKGPCTVQLLPNYWRFIRR